MFYNFNPMFDFRSIQQNVMNNPKFREFYEQNKNKTPEEVCKEYNLDWNTVRKLIGK